MNPEDTQATSKDIDEMRLMLMPSKHDRGCLALSKTLIEAFKRQCKAEGKKMSWVASRLIIEYLKKTKKGGDCNG